jgi:hypothetical protein
MSPDVTEKLIEKHNPKWKLGGSLGIHPRCLADMALAGFRRLETFSFDLDVPYSHEAWRGRIRASAGVGASLSPEGVAAFDCELQALLAEKFPQEPLAGAPSRLCRGRKSPRMNPRSRIKGHN